MFFFCVNVFFCNDTDYIYIMIIMLGRMMFNLISSLFNQIWDIWHDDDSSREFSRSFTNHCDPFRPWTQA